LLNMRVPLGGSRPRHHGTELRSADPAEDTFVAIRQSTDLRPCLAPFSQGSFDTPSFASMNSASSSDLVTVSTSCFARASLQTRCQHVRSSRFLPIPARRRKDSKGWAIQQVADRLDGKPAQESNINLTSKHDATDWTRDELVAILNDARAGGNGVAQADGCDPEPDSIH
jgi:hypothetical protein